MTQADKRELVERVGLCWHEWREVPVLIDVFVNIWGEKCIHCGVETCHPKEYLLKVDPTTPEGGQVVWDKFVRSSYFYPFKIAQMRGENAFVKLFDVLPNPTKRAEAMLEFLREQDG